MNPTTSAAFARLELAKVEYDNASNNLDAALAALDDVMYETSDSVFPPFHDVRKGLLAYMEGESCMP